MAYQKTPSHLWKKSTGLYHFKLGIPAPLQKHYPSDTPGKFKTHIVESLHTHNRGEALKLKEPLLVKYRGEFKRLSSGVTTKAINPAQARVPMLRAAMAEVLSTDTDHAGEDDVTMLVLHDAMEQAARDIDKEEGREAADLALRKMANPGRATLREALKQFMAQSENKAQTVNTYDKAMRELLAFLKVDDCLPEDVTDAKAVAYVDMLNAGPLSKSVKVKRIGGVHQVWLNMRRRGWPISPWSDHKLTEPAKKRSKALDADASREPDADSEEGEDVRPFTDAEAIKIFTLPAPSDKRRRTYTRPLFRELYALGFITGMRLNEIVSLRPIDITVLEEGWRVVNIPKEVAKKKASIRKIPVCHPVAVAIIDARLEKQADSKGRLYSECAPGGPDEKPSWHVSKAMSIERLSPSRLGFGSEVNFHSTRRSFATLMENSLVADVIGQQRYLGHAIPTQMHGVYSGGSGVEKLKMVVSGLRYPGDLEEAFKLALPLALDAG
ncbi:DUF6538 domain-containing protein [Aquabacterium sp.]|uniref:DUF6538 domain-containing protein n=1 Tax=Aquabacterium sp. TaxID=1872578 RepID=UPI0025BA06F7|nr:DUF6538 domain-containing protein [Aquabacterium sp.]